VAGLVAESSAAAEAADAPIALMTQAIGKMNSAATVFTRSAQGVIEGLGQMIQAGYGVANIEGATEEQIAAGRYEAAMASMQLNQQAQAGGSTRNALLVGTAAKIAAQLLTTSDAKRVAEDLAKKSSFAGSTSPQLRDFGMLLDGLQAFDAKSFETTFYRLANALSTGQVNEGQYIDLLAESFKIVTDEADGVADAFDAVREAAKSLADSLMLDDTLSALTNPAMILEAQRQYEAAIAKARGGDSSDLDATSRKYLGLASDWSATAESYDMRFAQVISDVRALEKTPKQAQTTTDDVVAALDTLRTDLQTLGATTASNQNKLQRLLEALTDAGDALNVKVVS
jgi:hypothetical protein